MNKGETSAVHQGGHPEYLEPGPGVGLAWIAAVFLLILAGIAAYANSFTVPFLLDDHGRILNNPDIHQLWPLTRALNPDANLGARPIINLTLAVNWALGGESVFGYHLFNLIVHILAGLTLFGLVRRSFYRPRLARFRDHALGLAFFISLLWMVHPVNAPAVTYIIQRCESMMGLFYLLTMYLAIRGWQSKRPGDFFGLAAAACVLGLLSKESMVTAPFMVLAYDWAFVSGRLKTALIRHKSLYLELLLALVVLAAWRAAIDRVSRPGPSAGNIEGLSALITAPLAFFHYFKAIVWPVGLVFDYQWPAADLQTAWPFMLGLAALLAVSAWAFFKRRPVGFLAFWFFGILFPTTFLALSGRLRLAYDYRLYLPLAAATVLFVCCGYILLSRREAKVSPATAKRLKFGAVGVLVALAVLLGALTRDYNRRMNDPAVLWRDAVAWNPANARALNNLGSALYDRGRYQKALTRYNQSLALAPKSSRGRFGRGLVLEALGRLEDAERAYRKALDLNPDEPHFNMALADVLHRQGRVDQAATYYRRSLELDPKFIEAHSNYGKLLMGRGEYRRAVRSFLAALEIDPGFPPANFNLAAISLKFGKLRAARDHLITGLKGAPDDQRALRLLEQINSRLNGRTEENGT